MTERTRFLREQTLLGQNKCARRRMPPMDVSGEPGGIPIRKALGFRAICRQMPLYIGPGELIVGTRTFFGAPAGPDSPVDWSYPPLIAYPTFVTEEEIRLFGGDYSRCNSQHYTPDLGLLLDKGIGGILEQARQRKTDPSLGQDRQEFLDSVIIVYSAMAELIGRYAEYARQLAAAAREPEEKARFSGICHVCSRIAYSRPGNYREALQLLWFGHLGTTLESFYFINYGRLDVILGPYLGDMPREEALELTECLLLKMYDQADVRDQSYVGTYGGQLVVTLGGLLPDGSSAVNPVTMLFLEAAGFTRLPEPEFNLRIAGCNPAEYLELASRLTVQGCNFVSYYNDDVIVPALMAGGLSPEDARSYGFDLCQDINIPGKSDFYNLFGTSLAHDLMTVLGWGVEYDTFEDLLRAFSGYFYNNLDRAMDRANLAQRALLAYGAGDREEYFRLIREEQADPVWDGRHPMCPLPYLSGMFHGCLEQAADMIYEPYPIRQKGAMLGTAVEGINSLAAIRKVVYEDRVCTLQQLYQACREDFRGPGQEVLRRLLRNAPKWGNDDSSVDILAKEVLEPFLRKMGTCRTYSGGPVLSGIHQPHPVATGWDLMATPNGRHAGTPVAVTMTPESGTMKNGATAAMKSASVFDPMLLQWNYCFMINYYGSVFAAEQGAGLFRQLLTAYFRRGGVQHQPNVMDGELLKKARLEPENYRDLVVRLWGISAHFVDLPGELQDELIARVS